MMYPDAEFLVVGGGLAGALTVHQLRSADRQVVWIDRQFDHTATSTGAGIMNPITGRKFVYSWQFDRFFDRALEIYSILEKEPLPILHCLSIQKGLATPGDVNNWCLRLGTAPYDRYMREPELPTRYPFLNGCYQLGRIDPVFRVDMKQVVQAVCDKWGGPINGEMRSPRTAWINGQLLTMTNNQTVILATGAPIKDIQDVHLPLAPYQGQALLIHSAELPQDVIFHHKLKVVPYGNEIFWVGTFDRWDDRQEVPDAQGRQKLEDDLNAHFHISYTVIDHLSGIRPSSRTRRPFAGPLVGWENTYVINGLGTKGASLAPLVVDHLCRHLLSGEVIPEEFKQPTF
ncbi:MAG: FAD-binding oxidoreductase [Saprospiraceae bacterium]|nr:FAD-binding oxidoreductase [Saprospiraceae bacterium]